MTDTAVPVENSLMFVAALRKAGVPVEFHLYERGPHGFGLGRDDPILSTWPRVALIGCACMDCRM
jgi:acetyl esterase/lipase